MKIKYRRNIVLLLSICTTTTLKERSVDLLKLLDKVSGNAALK
ncbi:MAG: hypothetical protein JWP81_2753 [Ferruginibacter sp.]|nr:hypothetical protein [Ferruginibacter sp.]